MIDILYSVVLPISIFLLVLSLLKLAIFISVASHHHRRHQRRHPARLLGVPPLVSIIVPCYNEELTLKNSIEGLLKQTYKHFEIVIVDNSSTDATRAIAKRLAKQHRNVRAITEWKQGKAHALNAGIKAAWGSVIVSMDADSIFRVDTVEQLVLSFEDPEVVAVGGNVRVVNRKRTLSKQQAVEYITGLNLQRRTFAHLGCMQVISGAIGAFRKKALEDIGGYPTDTIVEDMDITIMLAKRGGKIVFNPNAIAYTEAPETVKDFMKQRYRWTYGGFQVALKHRDMLFRPRARSMGMIGMPYFVIFPWVDAFVSLLLFFSLARVAITGDGAGFLLFFLGMSCLQAAVVFYALHLDKENKRLVTVAALDSLFYNHVISMVTLRAGFNFLRRKTTTWNKLQRYGKNTVPEAATASMPVGE